MLIIVLSYHLPSLDPRLFLFNENKNKKRDISPLSFAFFYSAGITTGNPPCHKRVGENKSRTWHHQDFQSEFQSGPRQRKEFTSVKLCPCVRFGETYGLLFSWQHQEQDTGDIRIIFWWRATEGQEGVTRCTIELGMGLGLVKPKQMFAFGSVWGQNEYGKYNTRSWMVPRTEKSVFNSTSE